MFFVLFDDVKVINVNINTIGKTQNTLIYIHSK
jgi:hypothetical protein